jgi:hypothetical protein
MGYEEHPETHWAEPAYADSQVMKEHHPPHCVADQYDPLYIP